MNSEKIKLFTQWPKNENENAIIEDIEEYILTLTFDEISSTKAFTPLLDLSLKLPLSQDRAITFDDGPYRYMRVQFTLDDLGIDLPYYYFIRKVERLANNTILITAHMDLLNTYQDSLLTSFTSKTMIIRQHEDRFHALTSGWPKTGYMTRKVDPVSEGLIVAKQRSATFSDVTSNVVGDAYENYYLIYSSASSVGEEDANNPISCELRADTQKLLAVSGGASAVDILAGDLSPTYFYYILASDLLSGFRVALLDNGMPPFETVVYENSTVGTISTTQDLLLIESFIDTLDANKIKAKVNQLYHFYDSSTPNDKYFMATNTPGAILNPDEAIRLSKVKQLYYSQIYTTDEATIRTFSKTLINSGYYTQTFMRPIASLNKADSKLVKIIKLPYAPTTVNYDPVTHIYSFDNFTYDVNTQKMLLNSPDIEFENTSFTPMNLNELNTEIISGAHADFVSLDATINYLHDDFVANYSVADSKIYHSDFYTLKFSYDSFSKIIQNEFIITKKDTTPLVEFRFKPTNTINSNFLWEISLKSGTYTSQVFSEDFADYLLSTRNNEITIYSNAYINYLKTGYNYDKKAKATQNTANWLTTALSLAGGVGSAVVGGVTGNPIAAAAGVGLITGGLAQITNAIATQVNNDNAMASKLSQLRAQSTAVAGSDDINLLSDYGDNKLRTCVYKPSTIVQSMLEKLFHFYGYLRNYQGIPNFSSRVWFNFIQCQPDFDFGSFTMLKKAELDEVSQKFSDGVTIFHHLKVTRKPPLTSISKWDLAQELENFETFFIN